MGQDRRGAGGLLGVTRALKSVLLAGRSERLHDARQVVVSLSSTQWKPPCHRGASNGGVAALLQPLKCTLVYLAEGLPTVSRRCAGSYGGYRVERWWSPLCYYKVYAPAHLDRQGRFFIDRNGDLFGIIMSYLRDEPFSIPTEYIKRKALAEEASFFQAGASAICDCVFD